jgi:serine/threonine protein kinase
MKKVMDILPVINGYRLLRPWSTAGGGMSKWSFAEKGGKEFFFKEFLHPTYPSEDAPGSQAVKAGKRKLCEAFEQHQEALSAAVRTSPTGGGNLIHTIDFFRFESRYYKVTEKVDVTTLPLSQISQMSLSRKLLLLTTMAHSLRTLHRLNIVHSDLKPANMLVKQTPRGAFTAKLIDFDSAYFSARPPALQEEVIGDMAYYSPELARYLMGHAATPPADLTIQSDIFSLGLLFSEFLTGHLPAYDRTQYEYCCVAVNHGIRLQPKPEGLPVPLLALVSAMLHYVPKMRPTAEQVFEILRTMMGPPSDNSSPPPPPPPKDVEPPVQPQEGSMLKGTLLKK